MAVGQAMKVPIAIGIERNGDAQSGTPSPSVAVSAHPPFLAILLNSRFVISQ